MLHILEKLMNDETFMKTLEERKQSVSNALSFIYTTRSEQLWGFSLCSNLIHGHVPCMKFLFVRPDVCKFYLTIDTLALGYAILAIRARSVLAPVSQCSC